MSMNVSAFSLWLLCPWGKRPR